MPVPLIAGAAVVGKVAGAVGGLFKSPSARYGGGDGPLMSTVNDGITQIAAGSLEAIRAWDTARKTAARGRAQWGQVWVTELPRIPLTSSQVALVKSLDPSLPIQAGGALPYNPASPASPGSVGAGNPDPTPGGATALSPVVLVVLAVLGWKLLGGKGA